MKNRIELARYFKEQGFTKGAEIGVCDGRYSEILMRDIPSLTLLGVDPYRGYENGSVYRNHHTMFDNLRMTIEKLQIYPQYILMVTTSLQAATVVPDNWLDFVFIDALHEYEHVKEDITAWYPKVRSGGIMSGHDYYESRSGKLGIVRAVDEFVAEIGADLQTTEWDTNAYSDDKQPDWYFTKR